MQVSPAVAAVKTGPFSTAHLMGDLKRRSVRGGVVTMAAQGGQFALQLGSTAVLARILTPADFGLIAMVTAVTGFVAMFKDAGLSMATVQRETVTHDQVSTLFWINVALSIGLMALTAALAPAIAWFYGEPRLTAITLALAATFVFGGLTVQHQALLQRQMRFTELSAIAVATMAIGVAVAIASAAAGWGYWALVVMAAAQAVANAVFVWMASGWTPGWPVRGSGVMPMLKFGGNLTGFNFVNYFSRNADNVLIGWWWGAGTLGIYSKAYALLLLPIRQSDSVVTSITIPLLSRLQNNEKQYSKALLKIHRYMVLLFVPLLTSALIFGDTIIILILGEKWIDAVSIFRIYCIISMLQLLARFTGWVFVSIGRADIMMKTGLVGSSLAVLSFALGVPWGLEGVAYAYLAQNLIWAPALICIATSLARIRVLTFVKSNGPMLIASLTCALVGYFLRLSNWDFLPHDFFCLVFSPLCGFVLIAILNREIRAEMKTVMQSFVFTERHEAKRKV